MHSPAPLSPQLQFSSCQPGAPGAGGDGGRSLGCCFNNLYFLSPLIGASPGRGCSPLLARGGLREARPNAEFSFSVAVKELFMPLFWVAGFWCIMRAVFLQRVGVLPNIGMDLGCQSCPCSRADPKAVGSQGFITWLSLCVVPVYLDLQTRFCWV